MRFHGMVGDSVSISASGHAWRPPDYITSPTKKLRAECKFRSDGDPEQKSDLAKRLNRIVAAEKELPHKGRGGQNETENSRDMCFAGRGEACLPFPSTCIANVHRCRRLTYHQRLFAIGMALLMAIALFVCLVTLLSKQLESVASKVDAQNEILRQSHHFNERFKTTHEQRSYGQTRKLLAISDSDGSHWENSLQGQYYQTYRAAFHGISKSVSAVGRILRILKLGQEANPIFSASLLFNNPSLSTSKESSFNTGAPSYTTTPLPHFNTEMRSNVMRDELQHVYDDLLLGKVSSPLQIPQGNASITMHERADIDPKPAGTGLHVSKMKHGTFKISSEIWGTRGLAAGRSPSPSSVLHLNALNIVGNVDGRNRTKRTGNANLGQSHTQGALSSPCPIALPHAKNQYNPWHTGGTGANKATQVMQFFQDKTAGFPEGAEVWELSREKSLCRIFNVARLPDGRLVLPKWMKKHEKFLTSRCGVKEAVFAVEGTLSKKNLHVDNNILMPLLKSQFEVDMTNSGRDLCGTTAPRNHMPHFATDIFLPLVASETFLGSGHLFLKCFNLLPTGAKGVEVRSVPPFSDFKPSLFVFEETWNRPSFEWVSRLAQFFLHPRVGFTLILAGKEKESRSLPPQPTSKIFAFRSVITSNIESHFPLGLFGPKGKNIVFDVNGISRTPAWTTRGMQGTPCRVQVTVLTRRGPRALLRLDELERKIKALFKATIVEVDFNVVDFEEKSFDEQVSTMQETNILIATHGAGNANFIFMRPSSAVIEIFPFSYKAGPFNSLARIFGLDYKHVMSAPQTGVFKECMHRHESNQRIKQVAFSRWDKAVQEEKASPWIHRLQFEKEFGEPGKSEGMTTRMCVRLQELDFNIDAVSQMALESGTAQCSQSTANKKRNQLPYP